ncbi:RDD family protein [Bernardetia sp. OM2101]|uniref:RDD family protein n=1 Tax=Bernardetia sp. OM2101 TaxID=3344876 RepID=UPI0035CEFD8A
MNSKHCGQTFTLKKFPTASNLKLSKAIVYDFQKPNIGSRSVAYLIDNIIGIICGFIAYTFFTELRDFFRFDAEFSGYVAGSLYMLFRDIFGIKSSIEKRIMGLYFIDYELKKKAHIVSLLFRNLVYWVFLCMIISIIIILELKIDAGLCSKIVFGFKSIF